MEKLIVGEVARTLDERYRLSLPADLLAPLAAEKGACFLAKERPGCLSLWSAADWKEHLESGIRLVESKIIARRLDGRLDEVLRLGRLLSTRHRPVQLAGRGRLVVPEGFREFLGVEPNGTAIIVGAAVCIEIWHPDRLQEHIGQEMPEFRGLLERLVG
jgi:MraZ protein